MTTTIIFHALAVLVLVWAWCQTMRGPISTNYPGNARGAVGAMLAIVLLVAGVTFGVGWT